MYIRPQSLQRTRGHLEKCALVTLCLIGQTLLNKQIDSHNGLAEQFKQSSLIKHPLTILNLKSNSTMDTPKTWSQSKPVTMQVMIAGQLEPTLKLNL